MLVRGGATRASSVLARRGSHVAVFDTGHWHHTASLEAALAREGITPDQVTLVFNTHAHVDHSHGNVMFPRARILCSARDRAWTLAVHEALSRTERPRAEDVAPFYPEMLDGSYNPKLVAKVLGIDRLLWDPSRLGSIGQVDWLEDTPVPSGIAVVETPGHSPYHVSFSIQTERGPLLVCGDALLLRGEADYVAPRLPPWSLAAYHQSQAWIDAFEGTIVPGHDEPFDNHPSQRECTHGPAQNRMSKPPAK